MRMIINNKIGFWALLALPGLIIAFGLITGSREMVDQIAPSGEWSARFMIAAMMIGPLTDFIGPRPWLRLLMQHRRALGVAAFCYAFAHMLFYLIDMGAFAAILDELFLPGIWTGWAAIVLMLLPALSSNNMAMRTLKSGWKKLQRLVYPAAFITLLHWIWVHNDMAGALIHFAPLSFLYLARIFQYKPFQKAGAS